MELQRAKDEALIPGADLWVVGDLESSQWTQKIDWYLNFQIARSKTHKTVEQGTELKSVISQWEVEAPKIDLAATMPLMIASSDLLPNHSTVLVPQAGDVKTWAKRVFEVWKQLDEPSLRVFLPRGVESTSFANAWPGSKDDLAAALVPEFN